MRQALFYIESPFQLLQVYEAIRVFEIDSYYLIVRLNSSDRNNIQVRNLARLLELKVSAFYECRGAKLNCILLSVRLLWFSFFVKDVFVGDGNSKVFRMIERFIRLRKLILLDDGVASINRDVTEKEVKKFSIFRGQGDWVENEFVHISKFLSSQRQLGAKPVNLIVGSKLVEVNICNQNTYLNMLRDVIHMCDREFPIIYIAHRDEEEKNLDVIKKAFNIKVVKPKLPIELIANEINVRVCKVFTTISTALFSMKKVYPDASFLIYRIAVDDLIERKAAVENLYNYIEGMEGDNLVIVKPVKKAV